MYSQGKKGKKKSRQYRLAVLLVSMRYLLFVASRPPYCYCYSASRLYPSLIKALLELVVPWFLSYLPNWRRLSFPKTPSCLTSRLPYARTQTPTESNPDSRFVMT